MPLANEQEIKKILNKLCNAIDNTYTTLLQYKSYEYINKLINRSSMGEIISDNLTNSELNIFVAALSENEAEMYNLIKDNFSLNKFIAKMKEENTKSIAPEMLRAYANFKEREKAIAFSKNKVKEKHEIFKSAKFSLRQKQALTALGVNIGSFENGQ